MNRINTLETNCTKTCILNFFLCGGVTAHFLIINFIHKYQQAVTSSRDPGRKGSRPLLLPIGYCCFLKIFFISVTELFLIKFILIKLNYEEIM